VAISLKRRTDRPPPDSMTLVEHLGELRRRVLVSATAFLVMATVGFVAYNWILGLLKHPYCEASPSHCGFYVTGPLDGLALRVKIAAYAGIFLASPVWLWELWRFITPGLNPKEKRYAVPFIVATISLFTLGAAVAFLIFPHALQWLDSIGGPSLTQILVLLVSLELAGVITPQQLSSQRRWAIIGIVVLAGVITPSSDPFSMLAMAIPLYIFYELSIIIGKIVRR